MINKIEDDNEKNGRMNDWEGNAIAKEMGMMKLNTVEDNDEKEKEKEGVNEEKHFFSSENNWSDSIYSLYFMNKDIFKPWDNARKLSMRLLYFTVMNFFSESY